MKISVWWCRTASKKGGWLSDKRIPCWHLKWIWDEFRKVDWLPSLCFVCINFRKLTAVSSVRWCVISQERRPLKGIEAWTANQDHRGTLSAFSGITSQTEQHGGRKFNLRQNKMSGQVGREACNWHASSAWQTANKSNLSGKAAEKKKARRIKP